MVGIKGIGERMFGMCSARIRYITYLIRRYGYIGDRLKGSDFYTINTELNL